MIRWFISPIISVEVSVEDGGGVRRYPLLCYKDRYPCIQWGAVFFGNLAFVRFEAERRGSFDATDYIEELETAEQWNALYKAHPILKKRWSDQP